MVTKAEFFTKLDDALSGTKPKYASVKSDLSTISGIPVDSINYKNISAQNQVSARASESMKLKARTASTSWLFAPLITAESAAVAGILTSIETELPLFATVALVLQRHPNWSVLAIFSTPAGKKHAENIADFFGISRAAIRMLIGVPLYAAATPAPSAASISPDLFITDSEFNSILARLKNRKNIILQGPPGVGKTFLAKKLVESIASASECILPLQFHQSYGYEDFVDGWRPQPSGGFAVAPGAFMEFCRTVKPDLQYAVFIDEINRGNVPKIFGEVMTLMEPEKRSSYYALKLSNRPISSSPFYIPPNIHFIGTMNTADRSLAFLDYALRRRFDFVEIKPAFGTDAFENYLLAQGVNPMVIDHLNSKFTDLNNIIQDDERTLGPGFEIGHSYFCPQSKGEYSKDWYSDIIRYQIAPMLREYWAEDKKRAEERVNALDMA